MYVHTNFSRYFDCSSTCSVFFLQKRTTSLTSARAFTSSISTHLLFVQSHSTALRHNFSNTCTCGSDMLSDKFWIKKTANKHRILDEHERTNQLVACKFVQTFAWARSRAFATDTGRLHGVIIVVRRNRKHTSMDLFSPNRFNTAWRRPCLFVLTNVFAHGDRDNCSVIAFSAMMAGHTRNAALLYNRITSSSSWQQRFGYAEQCNNLYCLECWLLPGTEESESAQMWTCCWVAIANSILRKYSQSFGFCSRYRNRNRINHVIAHPINCPSFGTWLGALAKSLTHK